MRLIPVSISLIQGQCKTKASAISDDFSVIRIHIVIGGLSFSHVIAYCGLRDGEVEEYAKEGRIRGTR